MMMELVNVVFDDEQVKTAPSDTSNHPSTESVVDAPFVSEVTEEIGTPSVHKNHSSRDIIGRMDEGRRTRGVKINFIEMMQSACFVSSIEPKDHAEALSGELWIQAMQEELEQFFRNDVWELVENQHMVT